MSSLRAVRQLRWLMVPLLLGFWLVSLHNLARYPLVHYDEPIILSPGYKLVTAGVFGSDMFTGFAGQEQLFLETPPTLSLIQAASVALFGLGLWQMRVAPVVAGLLILALTYAVGVKLTGKVAVGLLAAFLLLFWRWTPGGDAFLGSGILLVDVARIARYDVLVPLFGLAGLGAWLTTRRRSTRVRHFVAGLLCGLAGFSNIYGLFFVVAVAALYPLDWSRRNWRRPLLLFIAGCLFPWLLWLPFVLLNWESATGQFVKHAGRFDLLQPGFYFTNLRTETQRYALGFRELSSYVRAGFWLVVAGIPAGIAWLLYRVLRLRDLRALYLLVPLLAIPLLMALLVSLKRHYYLLAFAPLAAILLGWGLGTLWQSRWRAAVALLLGLVLVQGLAGMFTLHRQANQTPPMVQFYAELQAHVPENDRIVGSPVYWLPFAARDYRSVGLFFVLTNPEHPHPLPFDATLENVRPEILLLDGSFERDLQTVEAFYNQPRRGPFARFMEGHRAELLNTLAAPDGSELHIYRLYWDES